MTYPVHLHIWINDLMIGFRGRMRDEKRGQGEGVGVVAGDMIC